MLWHAIRGCNISKVYFSQDNIGDTHYHFARQDASFYQFEDSWEDDKIIKSLRELKRSKPLGGSSPTGKNLTAQR